MLASDNLIQVMSGISSLDQHPDMIKLSQLVSMEQFFDSPTVSKTYYLILSTTPQITEVTKYAASRFTLSATMGSVVLILRKIYSILTTTFPNPPLLLAIIVQASLNACVSNGMTVPTTGLNFPSSTQLAIFASKVPFALSSTLSYLTPYNQA